MSRILSRRTVSCALFALAAAVAVNSFVAVNDAAAEQKPGKPASIMLQKDKPSVPEKKIPGRGPQPTAAEPGPATSFDTWCRLSGGGASTDENAAWVCIGPDGQPIQE